MLRWTSPDVRSASVSGVTEPTGPAVDELLNRVLLGDDPALVAALADSHAAGLPPIEVSPQAGQLLRLLARIADARRVLEIGTLGGYSTICLARGVGPEGSVVTLEYEPRHAEVARANLQRAGVADRVEIIVGAALDTLPTVTGEFDLAFDPRGQGAAIPPMCSGRSTWGTRAR